MFNAFYNLIYSQLFASGYFIDNEGGIISLFNGTIYFSQYLSILLALICTIVIYVVVCLFVVKIIKVFTNLFRG